MLLLWLPFTCRRCTPSTATVYSTITSHTQYAIKFLRPKCIGTLAYSSFAQDPATDLKEYVAPAEQQLLEKLYFAQLNIEDTWN